MATIPAFICWLVYAIFIYTWSLVRSLRAERAPQSWFYSIPVFLLALAGGTTLWFLWRANLVAPAALWVLFGITVFVQMGLLTFYIAGWYLFVEDRSGYAPFVRDIYGSGGFPEAAFSWSAMLWMVLSGQHLDATALTIISAAWLLPALGIKEGYGFVRIHADQSTPEKRTRSIHGPIDLLVLLSVSVLPVLVASVTSAAPVAFQIACPAIAAIAYFLAFKHALTTWALLTGRPSLLFCGAGPTEIALTLVEVIKANPAAERVLVRRLRSGSATINQIWDICTALTDPEVFTSTTADQLLEILRDQTIPAKRRAFIATQIPTGSSEGQVVWSRIAEDRGLCKMLEQERGLTITKARS